MCISVQRGILARVGNRTGKKIDTNVWRKRSERTLVHVIDGGPTVRRNLASSIPWEPHRALARRPTNFKEIAASCDFLLDTGSFWVAAWEKSTDNLWVRRVVKGFQVVREGDDIHVVNLFDFVSVASRTANLRAI